MKNCNCYIKNIVLSSGHTPGKGKSVTAEVDRSIEKIDLSNIDIPRGYCTSVRLEKNSKGRGSVYSCPRTAMRK